MKRVFFLSLLLIAITFALDGFASSNQTQNNAQQTHVKVSRKDPAFVVGYNKGYRRGALDSMTLANTYRDEGGPVYRQATDGYTAQYGDLAAYQRRFRRGYSEGYEQGWDFEAGQYIPGP